MDITTTEAFLIGVVALQMLLIIAITEVLKMQNKAFLSLIVSIKPVLKLAEEYAKKEFIK